MDPVDLSVLNADPLLIVEGDCVDVMRCMPANSCDAICTDPPYMISFMGRGWDNAGRDKSEADTMSARRRRLPDYSGGGGSGRGINAEQGRAIQDWHLAWATEALRVAKPGAYLVAFGGTRTWHRLMCAIEDAGWEVRDTIAHYRSGGGDATEAPALGPLTWNFGSGFP